MAKTNLIAIQAQMERPDYRDEEAFRAKIGSLMQMAAREADFSLPTLVSFPELIGMFLSFLTGILGRSQGRGLAGGCRNEGRDAALRLAAGGAANARSSSQAAALRGHGGRG